MLESSEVKMYQTILFDLDGTITDSGSGIMR
ncbi:TPA: HAD family hydrolase, partial [Enterococcus faecium]|nr:HAD family hydrolase [Enterococcus faecium]